LSIGPNLVEATVELDHLSVQRVEGAEAENSPPFELGKGDVANVFAVEQGVDGRGLKRGMGEGASPGSRLPM
jgi:hypothetical protein